MRESMTQVCSELQSSEGIFVSQERPSSSQANIHTSSSVSFFFESTCERVLERRRVSLILSLPVPSRSNPCTSTRVFSSLSLFSSSSTFSYSLFLFFLHLSSLSSSSSSVSLLSIYSNPLPLSQVQPPQLIPSTWTLPLLPLLEQLSDPFFPSISYPTLQMTYTTLLQSVFLNRSISLFYSSSIISSL